MKMTSQRVWKKIHKLSCIFSFFYNISFSSKRWICEFSTFRRKEAEHLYFMNLVKGKFAFCIDFCMPLILPEFAFRVMNDECFFMFVTQGKCQCVGFISEISQQGGSIYCSSGNSWAFTISLSDDQHSPSPPLSLDVQCSNFACGSCSFDYKLQVFFRKSGAVNPTNIMHHEIVVLKVPLREKWYLF